MFVAGVVIYARVTRPENRRGSLALWGLVAFLAVAYLGNAFGPPPPSATMIAYAWPDGLVVRAVGLVDRQEPDEYHAAVVHNLRRSQCRFRPR